MSEQTCATCGGATYMGREMRRCDGCDQAPTFCSCSGARAPETAGPKPETPQQDRAAPQDDFHAALLRNDAAHYLAMALADRGIAHEDKSLVDTIPILRVLDEYGFALVLRSSLPEGHWAKEDPTRARRFGEPDR